MPNESPEIEFAEGLDPLVELLGGIRRAGDFVAHGVVETPMPRLEIDGVGLLSFPVPEEQAVHLIVHAERAPFGRGEKTVWDESVRKVWQLPPSSVRISGKSWDKTLRTILDAVALGLGCDGPAISAELYKLLVYDRGGFFQSHRDTEKTAGMFGTLVITLPSSHRGGELVVRHAGREIRIDPSRADVSELSYAAFYADCEHEVRPILEGNRVCLVYNLLNRKGSGALHPPEYDSEVVALAELLDAALSSPGAPIKLVYALEHQYTPSGLSFAGLKNADLARAQSLCAAAARAECDVYLGLLHVSESGGAEVDYSDYGWRGRRRYHGDDDEEGEDDAQDEDFEIIEVYSSDRWIDQWIGAQDQPAGFGTVPLEEGELFPKGAFDDVKPDKQSVQEATGNEGASFERSYFRAAIILWRRDRAAEVLLQAGVAAVLPHFQKLVDQCREGGGRGAAKAPREAVCAEAFALANLILGQWPMSTGRQWTSYGGLAQEPSRAMMLESLCALGEPQLVEQFVAHVVVGFFDGSETEALLLAAPLLGVQRSGPLFSEVAGSAIAPAPLACATFLSRLSKTVKPRKAWLPALREIAASAVVGIGGIHPPKSTGPWPHRFREIMDDDDAPSDKPPVDPAQVTPAFITTLLQTLRELDDAALLANAAAAIASRPEIFDPPSIILPALDAMAKEEKKAAPQRPEFLQLWQSASEFLLGRSEFPPAEPQDWSQDVSIGCACRLCRELQAFARDPMSQTHRFPLAKDGRAHLHRKIEEFVPDMKHETERIGRPYTMVCTKTRTSYRKRCEQHQADLKSMGKLLRLSKGTDGKLNSDLKERLKASVGRSG